MIITALSRHPCRRFTTGAAQPPIAPVLRQHLALTACCFAPRAPNPDGGGALPVAPAFPKTYEVRALANDPRGTKREDPETGKKFYDLNKDPIVSPYTGKSYPRSYFEQTVSKKAAAREEEEEEEVEVEEVVAPEAPEIVSLEEADAEEAGAEEEIPEVEGVEEAEDIGEDDTDAFLEEDEDEDENLDFDVGGEER
jgi:uncharacterized protein (TIGR02300 family)